MFQPQVCLCAGGPRRPVRALFPNQYQNRISEAGGLTFSLRTYGSVVGGWLNEIWREKTNKRFHLSNMYEKHAPIHWERVIHYKETIIVEIMLLVSRV